MSEAQRPPRHKTMHWAKPDVKSARLSDVRSRGFESGPKSIPSRSYIGGIMVLLGSICGLGIFTLISGSFINPIREQHLWSGHSVVVFAQPAGTQVRLESEQNRQIAIAQISSSGRLTFDGLPPGQYAVTFEMPGHSSVFGVVSLEKDRATILGFPSPIKLVSD